VFGDFGNDLRNAWSNPFINGFLQVGGQKLDWLPAWPVFESLVGLVIVAGAIYYAVAQRGREDRVEADLATGEATIG
jgi:hypothetical protein